MMMMIMNSIAGRERSYIRQLMSFGCVPQPVYGDGQQNDPSLNDLLPEWRDVKQHKTAVEHTDDQTADDRSKDGATTA